MFMNMFSRARFIIGCALIAGTTYTLYPDVASAEKLGAVVCEYVQYAIQPKAIPAETYTEMIMIKVGLMEQRYESWGDRATQVYIYIVVVVTISVYVGYGVFMLFVIENPEKKKNACPTTEPFQQAVVLKTVLDTNVNNNKSDDEIDECTTKISLLTDECVMLKETCDKQSELMSGFTSQMERLDQKGMVAWKCFMVMLLVVIMDMILHLSV